MIANISFLQHSHLVSGPKCSKMAPTPFVLRVELQLVYGVAYVSRILYVGGGMLGEVRLVRRMGKFGRNRSDFGWQFFLFVVAVVP